MQLTLEYDGTGFHGWQAQPVETGHRTVAGELSRAITSFVDAKPRLIAAGRTDAGAHSLGQVVNFHLDREISPERLRDGLNRVLPPDLAVLGAAVVPDDFHARFSAQRRHYRYLVENRPARSALLRQRAWHVRHPLDLDTMRQAAGQLLGRRDLAAFGRDPAGRNTVRHLQALRVRRFRDAVDGAILAFDLTADAFLYGMVRRIVGFLVDVGLGRRSPSQIREVIGSTEPARVRVAPAYGLYQLRVEY
jgi:tRNA pseudouridine38-40 synthase